MRNIIQTQKILIMQFSQPIFRILVIAYILWKILNGRLYWNMFLRGHNFIKTKKILMLIIGLIFQIEIILKCKLIYRKGILKEILLKHKVKWMYFYCSLTQLAELNSLDLFQKLLLIWKNFMIPIIKFQVSDFKVLELKATQDIRGKIQLIWGMEILGLLELLVMVIFLI